MTDEEIRTNVEQHGDMVRVEVQMARTHESIPGDSVVDKPVTVAEVSVRDDPDTVQAVSDALQRWHDRQEEGQR